MPSPLLYIRMALPVLPGASRLPFVAGGGGDVPDVELTRQGVRVDRDHLADYQRVCGFEPSDRLPASYPHVLAFGLHMELMADGRFPFPAVGLVHVANAITQHRPLRVDDVLDLRVRALPVEPHPKGRTFTIVTEASVGGEPVWEDHSTMLRRGRPPGGASARDERPEPPAATETWELPEELGRRYGAVSGDRNPIHLHALTARLFGFPRAIAHGMWTKARCLAALAGELPDAFRVDVRFAKPILLPGAVRFGAADGRFAVRGGSDDDVVHLEGSLSR